MAAAAVVPVTVRILQGHVLDVLASLPERSVHVVCTSPPYWGLRAYGTEPQVWGAAEGCEHEWGDPITEKKRGQDAGDTARVGNTKARVCPPETQQGAFCQKCGAWRGELGSEPTLDLFVAHLVEVFAAVGRVLRDDGTLWVNLGDSYSGGQTDRQSQTGINAWKQANGGQGHLGPVAGADGVMRGKPPTPGLADGNLCMAPARFALAMQAAGWTLRSEITLCKTAPMPESIQGARWERCRVKVAKGAVARRGNPIEVGYHASVDRGGQNFPPGAEWADCPGCPKCAAAEGYVQRWGSGRPTSATEKLFLFSKAGARYFYDAEAVRVALKPGADHDRPRGMVGENHGVSSKGALIETRPEMRSNPAGRNLWNYVMWAPEPLKEGHYAAFPRWLPRLAIRAGTSERGVCPGCGAPWLRVVERTASASEAAGRPKHLQSASSGLSLSGHAGAGWEERGATSTTLGWRPSCACPPAEPAPAVCLDPFAGSGTSLIEANALGRHGWGIELQAKYVAIAHQRLSGQPLSLFAHEAAG